MIRILFAAALMVQASAAAATDFGVRTVPSEGGGAPVSVTVSRQTIAPQTTVNLETAARLGAQWGRVTSLRRSAEHNRRVGGVRNSYHLSGRAIDIARRPGVRHADIAAAFRRAGFHLLESLDEGDHSHFAFGAAPATRGGPAQVTALATAQAPQSWKVVYAPGSGRSGR